MPWKECHVMDERLRFVARLLEGEKMARLCAEFGISRKTGYKIYDRYKDCGVGAFSDRSRRPHRQANRLPPQLEATIVEAGVPGVGCPQDSREAAAAVDAALAARHQHRPRRAGPLSPREAPRPPAAAGGGDHAVATERAERPVVC